MDYTDLHNLSLFSRLHLDSRAQVTGFALDVANMFHNIVLQSWLRMYFPLRCVTYGNLPGTIQRELRKKLIQGRRVPQNALVRPYQRTLPMGFK